jgi:MFS family permease
MSSYRWLVLVLIWAANVSGALIQLSGAPVQLAVAAEFHLSAGQVATWINLPLLSIALLSIPAGLAVDRVGSRTLIAVALLLMGVFGVARGASDSYLWLGAATFLFGVGEALLLSGMPKVVAEWFPPKELGLAVGIYTSGAAVGVLAAFLLGPRLFGDDWRRCFIATGASALVALIAWLALAKTPPAAAAAPHGSSVRQLVADIRYLLGVGDVRLLAGICACLQVAIFSWLALGFPFLVLARHVSPETAGGVVSLTMVGFLAGSVLTSFVSDRLGRRRPLFVGLGVLAAAGFLAITRLAPGAGLWTAVVLIGFAFATLQVLLFAVPLELPSVARSQVGACEGVIISLGFLAGIVASPLLGRIVGDLNRADGGPFETSWQILAATMFGLAAAAWRLTESGWKASEGPAA